MCAVSLKTGQTFTVAFAAYFLLAGCNATRQGQPGDTTNPQSGFKSKSNRDTDKKLVHLAPPTAHTIWRLEFIYTTRLDMYILHESVLLTHQI